MSKSYFPTDRSGRTDWYNNFAKEFPKVGKDLGFSDAEITNAVNDSKCEGIRFWARLEPGIQKDYDAEIVADQADAAGRHWVTITMLCDHEIHPTLPGDPSTPPPDRGESGPQHPLTASMTKPGAAKKKGTKKTAKKAAKKTVKKAAKKKR